MNFYVKINGVRYPITKYSYRLNNVDADTKVSHIFNCDVVSHDAIIEESDTIEFYQDGILIYTDPINTVIQNGSTFSIYSEKIIAIPTTKQNEITELFYHSSVTLRMPVNFNLIPLDTLSTDYGVFTVYTIVHYDFMSEVTIG